MLHSIESEQIVLGTILLTPENSSILIEELVIDDFSNTYHRIIFEAIKTAIAEGYNPSPVILAPKLKDINIPETGINCAAYLGKLVLMGTIMADALGVARNVKDMAARRTMIALAQQMNDAAKNPMASITDTGIGLIKNIDEICTRAQRKRQSMFGVSTVAEDIMKSIQNKNNKEIITTGLIDLDKFLGGFHRGEVLFAAGRPSMGKAQALNAPILLEDGKWKKMEDIQIGDRLASIDGQPSIVSRISPQGVRQLYTITFSDGRSAEADGEHLWSVRYREWDSPRIMTTLEIKNKLSYNRYANRIWIDRISGVFGTDDDLPMSPYVLGALLANGGLTGCTPRITTPYNEVIEQISGCIGNDKIIKNKGKYCYSIIKNGVKNYTTLALRKLGLFGRKSHEKFIPEQYLSSTFDSRASLLRGLLDGDGWIEKFGAVRYATSSKQLADDIVYLVRSLGGVITINEKNPTYTYNGTKKSGKTSYVLNMSFECCPKIFFGVKSKKTRAVTHDRTKRLNIISICESRCAEAACISVTHPSQLYITSDYVATHNSALILAMARQSARAGVNWLIFSLEMRKEAVVNRMLSDMVWGRGMSVPYERIAKGDLADHEIYRLSEAVKRLEEFSIMIDEQAGLSAAEIAIRSRRYAEELAKQGKRLDVIAVDHLGKVRASDRYSGNKVHETGEKSNAFAILARDLDVSLVVAHQLNRANEKRENKRPELSDMRDSGDIEQDADTIIFPFRLAYYLERIKEDDQEKEKQRLTELERNINMIEIGIGKNRNGRCKTIELFCDMGSNVIRDLA